MSAAVFCLTSCHQDIPMVNLGIDDVYVVERMRKVILHPEFPGKGYYWYVSDSLYSTERDLVFCTADTGTYHCRLHIDDLDNPVYHSFDIVVWEEQVAFSPWITEVYEFCPAPGQFVEELPIYEDGDTYEVMLNKVKESISGTNQVMISLGNFGGYVTFGFDHSVCNVAGENDFRIWGNAFIADSKKEARMGGSCEPGIVMVSIDRNENGLPDDEWYELAGSEYTNPLTKHNYTVTYYRTPADHEPTPLSPRSPLTDTTYIRWTDNYGGQGYMTKNAYHKHEWFPRWIADSTLTFTGTCLPPNGIDESGNGTYYVLYAYGYGYVDNAPNDSIHLNSYNIDWAVDRNGNHVHLPCADFVRVYTGMNQVCGWLGESSTELSGAADLHVPDPHAIPQGIKAK